MSFSVLTACVQAWVHWIHAYIGNQEGAGARDNASVHSTFYSVCQAVFYVVAFRVKEILALRNGKVPYFALLAITITVHFRLRFLEISEFGPSRHMPPESSKILLRESCHELRECWQVRTF